MMYYFRPLFALLHSKWYMFTLLCLYDLCIVFACVNAMWYACSIQVLYSVYVLYVSAIQYVNIVSTVYVQLRVDNTAIHHTK